MGDEFEGAAALREQLLQEGRSESLAHVAYDLWRKVEGHPQRCGDSEVVDGHWLETHTLGCRNSADEPEAGWWDSHYAILDQYRTDGMSLILGDPTDGIFLTITPQRIVDSLPA